ncbi:hypothetical protein A6R68_22331 [Neotoma lepida]|uniref:Uncharacterized protein n=1 Tax=Neotoma lepida TaxID=56216 RepID=A0A1A6HZL5_NEOLE|nr:hypothetical protein A6R68_22331 [Neotoma lepida]
MKKVEKRKIYKKKKTTSTVKSYIVQEELNKIKHIWTRNPDDFIQNEYGEFCKSITNKWEDHFENIYLQSPAGPQTSLRTRKITSNFYVHLVLITDSYDELIPEYLNYICKSHEKSKIFKVIHKNILKRYIEFVSQVTEDKENYKEFYKKLKEFNGNNLVSVNKESLELPEDEEERKINGGEQDKV